MSRAFLFFRLWLMRPPQNCIHSRDSVNLSGKYLVAVLYAGVLLFQASAKAQPILEVTGNDFDVDLYGRIFVLDRVHNTLKLFSQKGDLLKEVGGAGWNDGQFDSPQGVWARNGIDVFVADYGNHRIQRFDRNLNFVSSFSTRDNDDPGRRFGYPADVTLSRQGDLFLCDGENIRVLKVSGFNSVEGTFGEFGAGKGRLLKPSKIETGPKDYLYVTDNGRVMVYDSFGNFVQELGPVKFSGELLVYADMQGIVVVQEDTVYCFDGGNRWVSSFPLALLGTIRQSDVKSMVIANDRTYFLTDTGVESGRNLREMIVKE